MSRLAPCPSCARHVRTAEPECPFCSAALGPSHPLAAGLAVVLALSVAGCGEATPAASTDKPATSAKPSGSATNSASAQVPATAPTPVTSASAPTSASASVSASASASAAAVVPPVAPEDDRPRMKYGMPPKR
jgi:hypothetical protein